MIYIVWDSCKLQLLELTDDGKIGNGLDTKLSFFSQQHTVIKIMLLYLDILYFAWEDQSKKVCCIDHKVVINCITVLYEPYNTVMQLIGYIQHCYALN